MSAEILSRNLAAVAAKHGPAGVAAIQAVVNVPPHDGLLLEPTQSGIPTLSVVSERGSRVYIHSSRDPAKEAQRIVGDISPGPLDSIVAFGLGLGHHLVALAARLGPENGVLIFERDPAVLALALRNVDLSPLLSRCTVHFVVGDDILAAQTALREHQGTLLAAKTHVLSLPAAVAAFPAFYEARREVLRDFCRTAQIAFQTLFVLSRGNFEQRAANIVRYTLSPGVAPLRDRFRGLPGFVVSAGPSLRRNVHLLSRVKGKGVIIAVGTALKPLLAAGVRPDFVCVLDYSPLAAKYFEGIAPADAPPLVCDVKANSRTVGVYPGRLLFAGEAVADTLSGRAGGDKGLMETGATVAQTAYFFALHAGCAPIVFVGQDLSYSHGVIHVPGTGTASQWRGEISRWNTLEMLEWDYLARNRKGMTAIPGWGGGTVLADSLMFSYLRDFEILFAGAGRQIIDATEGGALKKGAEPMRLETAIDRHATNDIPAETFAVPPGPDPGVALPALERALAGHLADAKALATDFEDLVEELRRVKRRSEAGKASDRIVDRIHKIRDRVSAPRYAQIHSMLQAIGSSDSFARNRKDRTLDAGKATGVDRQGLQAGRDLDFVEGMLGAARFFEVHAGRALDEVRRARVAT